jgi:hypothetical protein
LRRLPASHFQCAVEGAPKDGLFTITRNRKELKIGKKKESERIPISEQTRRNFLKWLGRDESACPVFLLGLKLR